VQISIQSLHDVRPKIKEALDNWKDFTAKQRVLQSYVSSNPDIKNNSYFANNMFEKAERNTTKIQIRLLDYQQNCAGNLGSLHKNFKKESTSRNT
jgi:hypothetical protein